MDGLTITTMLKREGYTVTALSEKMGMTASNLSHLLRAKDVRSSTIEGLSAAIKKPISWFYGESVEITAVGNVGDNSPEANKNASITAGINPHQSAWYEAQIANKDKEIAQLHAMLDKALTLASAKKD